MTIAIGLNLGSYAILAADTRTTYYGLGQSLYDDNTPKVHRTSIGLITGAGFCPLLDAVRQRLAVESVTNTDSIVEIIRAETSIIQAQWQHLPDIERWISHTGWLFTYSTQIDDNEVLRLGVFHPSVSRDLLGYVTEIGRPMVIWPIELDGLDTEPILSPILSLVNIPSNDSQIQPSTDTNMALIRTLITSVHPYCESVSNRLQFGVHRNRVRGTSEIIDLSVPPSNIAITLS